MCVSYPETLQDRLQDLGDIPLSRIVMNPAPGLATTREWLVMCESGRLHYELIDGTLVEKSIGWLESLLGMLLGRWLGNYVAEHQLGVVTGADGFTEFFPEIVRGPDVAFVSWNRMPEGKLPTSPLPRLVPNFVIEVLSQGNTYGEMSRKRREYFQAGVELVWMVDLRDRTITVFFTSQQFEVVKQGERIDARPVLPGWTFDTADLFAILDQQPPSVE